MNTFLIYFHFYYPPYSIFVPDTPGLLFVCALAHVQLAVVSSNAPRWCHEKKQFQNYIGIFEIIII